MLQELTYSISDFWNTFLSIFVMTLSRFCKASPSTWILAMRPRATPTPDIAPSTSRCWTPTCPGGTHAGSPPYTRMRTRRRISSSMVIVVQPCTENSEATYKAHREAWFNAHNLRGPAFVPIFENWHRWYAKKKTNGRCKRFYVR